MKYLNLTILFIFFKAFQSFSQSTNSEKIEKVRSILNERHEVVINFLASKNKLQYFSSILSIDNYSGGKIRAYANRQQFLNFLKLNIDFDIVERKVATHLKRAILSWTWDEYPTYSQYLLMVDSLAHAFPQLCRVEEIGQSVKGRKILFVEISKNTGTSNFKPQVMYSSTMHGDELLGYFLMMRLIDYMLKNYGRDILVTKLIDNLDIWINPLSNPDGTYAGGDDDVYLATRDNANEVDLNRNFSDPVKGLHPDNNDWQPENIAMMNFIGNHRFVLSANFHTGGELINYPWDSHPGLPVTQSEIQPVSAHPDSLFFQFISKEYVDTVRKKYKPTYFTDVSPSGYIQGNLWYIIYGGRQDYITYFHQGREITIELYNSENKITPASLLNNYWNYNRQALLRYLEQAIFGIQGTVTDSVSNLPIRAKIEIVGHDTLNSFIYSDALSGNYQRLIAEGSYDLKFSAPGYSEKIIQNVNIQNYETTWMNVNLSPVNKELKIEVSDAKNFVVWPNPFINEFDVYPGNQLNESYKLSVYDMNGRLITKTNIPKTDSGKIIHVIIPNSTSSIYLLKVQTFQNEFIQKVVKVRGQ